MDLKLNNKVALVAASSQGLGKACAESLLREGAKVVITGRRPDVLAKTAQELRQVITPGHGQLHTISGDLMRNEDVKRTVKATIARFGQLDILVTNSGGPKPGLFEETRDEDWQAGLESTLYPVINLIRQCIPHLKDVSERGGGRIINIVSTSAKQPIDGLLLSNAIRPAVVGLAKTLSKELAPYGILINNVCPGSFDTDRIAAIYASRSHLTGKPVEQIAEEDSKRIPLGRLGVPAELGDFVAFLASEKSSYITGQTVSIDGGAVSGIFG